MSNPTYNSANLTREAGKKIEKYRLVKSAEGKVEHAGAADFPFGAVTEAAAPKDTEREENFIGIGLPYVVRVHAGQAVVKLETEDSGFKEGDEVFAAADGKVAKSGTVKVGLADRPEDGKLLRVHLFHPAINVTPATGSNPATSAD